MRFYLMTTILLVICLGCETCKQTNEYGKCVDSERCDRPHITLNWELESRADVSFDAEALESVDQVFVWSEIYEQLRALHILYLTRLKESGAWCDAYSNCQVTAKEWEEYWQTMNTTASEFLKIKTFLARRLAEIQERGINNRDRAIILAMVHHLKEQMRVYDRELALAIEKLGQCLSNISVQELQEMSAKFIEEASYAERGEIPEEHLQDGWEEKGSGKIFALIANANENLKKLPARN